MKKLRLGKIKIEGAEVLSREQLKRVMGGSGTPGGNNGDPCPSNCTQYCHQTFISPTYNPTDTGTCPPDPSYECHNYCCEAGGSYYWC